MNKLHLRKKASLKARLAVLFSAAAVLLACQLTAPAGEPSPTPIEATVERSSPTPQTQATRRPTNTQAPTNTLAPTNTPAPTNTTAPTGTPAGTSATEPQPTAIQSEILEKWQAPIAAGTFLATGCEAALDTAELRARGAIDAEEARMRQTGAAFILSAAQVSIENWDAPPDLVEFKAQLSGAQQKVRDALLNWEEDRSSAVEIAGRLGEACPQVHQALDEVISQAQETGLSAASLESISEDVRAQLEQMGNLNGAMRPTPTPGEQSAAPSGWTRRDPLDGSQTVQLPGWRLQITDMISGGQALQRLESANAGLLAPPAGWAYLLVQVQITNTQEAPTQIVPLDFGLTGNRGVRYTNAEVNPPGPRLDALVDPGESASGWLVFLTGEDERDLMLVYDEFIDFDPAKVRYIALEQGASVAPPRDLPEPNDLGLTPEDPSPQGETVLTGDWAVTITETLRGEAAAELVQAAAEENPSPPSGQEYLALRIHAQSLAEGDQARLIDRFSFRVLDETGQALELPDVRAPFPTLDVFLYPGGEFTGWVILQVPEDLEDPVILFSPWNAETDARRYLVVSPET